MSGLTIGLLSYNKTMLKVLIKCGEKKEQKYAKAILPLVKNKHLLLVTLLICNSIAVEALPVFLNRLVSEYFSIIISVSFVLLFGEIIPQAICSRNALVIGYFFYWPVKLLIYGLFPISYPISKLLDYFLGLESPTYFRRKELKELIKMHEKNSCCEEALCNDEVKIIRSVLDMTHKKVSTCYTSLNNVFYLTTTTILTEECIQKICCAGHSRIPIMDEQKKKIVGVLYAKHLVLVYLKENFDRTKSLSVANYMKKCLLYVDEDAKLYDILNQFQEGKSHMAVVLNRSTNQTLGIITLEDIIEELISEEIIDETDVYVDVQKKTYVIRSNHSSHTLFSSRDSTIIEENVNESSPLLNKSNLD